MAGRCIPNNPQFKNDTEQQVWQAMRAKLRDVDVLLHGVRFSGKDGDWEADLVLLTPEGFATIEVKGGKIFFHDGQYVRITGQERTVLDLADQAVSEKYLVRRHLQHHPRWFLRAPRIVHFVALPHTPLGPDEGLGPGLPRDLIFAEGEESTANGRIFDRLTGYLANQPTEGPGLNGVQLAAEILGGQMDSEDEIAAIRTERDSYIERLTEEQFRVVDMLSLMPRYQIIGGPGTGKTSLAMEQARRWAVEGNRVAFIAYSRGLTAWVSRSVAQWSSDIADRVVATTFHDLGFSWGATIPGDSDDQGVWDTEVPRQMAQLADNLASTDRFDAVVIDEGQDFGATWWPVVFAAFRDREAGKLAVFSDSAQQIFGREGAADLDLPPILVSTNIRNSGPIAETVNKLLPTSLRVKGGWGPEVRFVPCPTEDAIDTADNETEALLTEGWLHSDIALLTSHHRHPVHVELLEHRGRDGYWDSLWDDEQFFYCTVAGFKGLERPAIVLAINGFRDPSVAREVLTVGLSRARDLLVVCGDLDEIRSAGNKELAKRLERAVSTEA